MDQLTGKYAVGGFCAGLMAGGLMVFLLNMAGGGSNLGVPLLFALGGAAGAYMQLRDA